MDMKGVVKKWYLLKKLQGIQQKSLFGLQRYFNPPSLGYL